MEREVRGGDEREYGGPARDRTYRYVETWSGREPYHAGSPEEKRRVEAVTRWEDVDKGERPGERMRGTDEREYGGPARDRTYRYVETWSGREPYHSGSPEEKRNIESVTRFESPGRRERPGEEVRGAGDREYGGRERDRTYRDVETWNYREPYHTGSPEEKRRVEEVTRWESPGREEAPRRGMEENLMAYCPFCGNGIRGMDEDDASDKLKEHVANIHHISSMVTPPLRR